MPPSRPTVPDEELDLEARISEVGHALGASLNALLDDLPDGRSGPQRLAQSLGLDKVLASRLLKAARAKDPMAVAFHLPGPEPMRRFLRAAAKKGGNEVLVETSGEAIDSFQDLIREEIGDRSSLDTIISAWLPDARTEFELRRKQALYKSMSQLKGASVDTTLATVFLHPSDVEGRIDLVWVLGLLGVRRLRPGAAIKLSSRRQIQEDGSVRRPTTLDGRAVEDLQSLRLDAFCDAPPARLDVRRVGDVVHYLLAEGGYGKRHVHDLLLAELNRGEMPSTPAPGRRGYVFAEVTTPSKSLLFDVLVHEDLYPGLSPELLLYDTSSDGVVDANDPTREIDRLDLAESIAPLGRGRQRLRVPDLPAYMELVTHVEESLGWRLDDFRTFRCRIEYPLHGAQVVAAFDPRRGV